MSHPFGTLPLGLTDADEERAARLHRDSIIVELMHQGPTSYHVFTDEMVDDVKRVWAETDDAHTTFIHSMKMPVEMAMRGELPEYEEHALANGITCANIQDSGIPGQPLLRNVELEHHARISRATCADDVRKAKANGTQCWFLNYQNYPERMDLDYVTWSREQGVMMAGLTYNNPNMIGVGCTNEDTGVTAFGEEVIALMNDLGMIVDISHAGARTTVEACRLSTSPVVASHTGAEAVYGHPRCKSDDELRAIADTGGVIGILAAPDLLTDKVDATLEVMFDHLDHVASVVGTEHVALGTDWPMQVPKWVLEVPFKRWLIEKGFREGDVPRPEVNFVGFDDYRDYPNITRLLVKRGYSDDEIQRILGRNALRVFDAVWG